MANRVGSVVFDVLQALPAIAPDFLPYQFNNEAEGWLGSDSTPGTHTSTQPITEPARNRVGKLAGSFSDIFYNRVLIEPGVLDVGNLVSDQSRDITVFNGYFENKTLEDILIANGDGLTLTGPTLPAELLPLQTVTYTLTLLVEGPATIDAALQFDVEGTADDTIVTVTGARIVILPYQPAAPWSETLEWKTGVLTSNSGLEQRSRLRKAGRQAFRGTYPVPKDDMGRALNNVYGWIQRRWAVGVWSEAQVVGALTAGALFVACETGTSDIRAGSTVVVWDNERQCEVIEVSSIEDGIVHFDRELFYSYTRAMLMPCRIGRINGSIGRRTNGHTAQLDISYDVVDNIEITSSAPEQYAGQDIYWDAALLGDSGDLLDSVSARIDLVDYGGVTDMYAPNKNNRIARPYNMVKVGSEETWAMRQFLHRRAGRWRPFWMPSFENDMRLAMTGLVTTAIRIEDDDYRSLGSAHNHIAIQYDDGSWRARAVTGVSVADDEQLILAMDGAALNVDASRIRMLSFLGLKRLDTDRVEIQWPGNGVATCSVRIMEFAP